MSRIDLPAEFDDLADLGTEWIIPGERDRHVKRVTSSLETVRGFYERVLPRLDAMIAFLQHKDRDTLTDPERNLYVLCLVCIEMSHPIDLNWATTDIDDTFPWQRIELVSVGY